MRFIERDWLSSNQVLFLDGDTAALVDSGYAKHERLTIALVDHLLQGRRLVRLLNTHLHSDHCGGNALLQRSHGCRTSVPIGGLRAVRDWDTDALSFAATGQRCDRFRADDALHPGETLTLGGMSWRALAAPGHDPDSLILYCRDERILISADALWQDGFGVIFPELHGDSGFVEQRAVLETIAALDVRVVLPGHGPMFTDVDTALARAFGRLDYLQADPRRNARHAIKVLVKFLLLDREAIPRAELPGLMAGLPVAREANRRHLDMTPAALSDWVVAELVRAGAARIDGELLRDH